LCPATEGLEVEVKSSAVFVSLVAVLVGLVIAVPAAGDSTDQIHVGIKELANGKSRYTGRIISQFHDCVERRTVKVTSRDSRLVKTKTDSDGKFNAVGKTPVKGSKVTVTVPPKGTCPKLVGTTRAS
jgi:hypothetical protein